MQCQQNSTFCYTGVKSEYSMKISGVILALHQHNSDQNPALTPLQSINDSGFILGSMRSESGHNTIAVSGWLWIHSGETETGIRLWPHCSQWVTPDFPGVIEMTIQPWPHCSQGVTLGLLRINWDQNLGLCLYLALNSMYCVFILKVLLSQASNAAALQDSIYPMYQEQTYRNTAGENESTECWE